MICLVCVCVSVSLFCRSFSVPAFSSTLGDKVARVQLLQPDSNPANNFDDAVTSPFINCGAPFGLLSPKPACPAGTSYLGPDAATLGDPANFGASCCVSR
jgi:hypothetical protein